MLQPCLISFYCVREDFTSQLCVLALHVLLYQAVALLTTLLTCYDAWTVALLTTLLTTNCSHAMTYGLSQHARAHSITQTSKTKHNKTNRVHQHCQTKSCGLTAPLTGRWVY